jgi:hypothetical protein
LLQIVKWVDVDAISNGRFERSRWPAPATGYVEQAVDNRRTSVDISEKQRKTASVFAVIQPRLSAES